MDKPNYYSILTSEVRYDKSLSDSEKILYTEISALADKYGECWASNKYFAGLYGVSERTISRRISKLNKLGHVKVFITRDKATNKIEKRTIKINYSHDFQEDESTRQMTAPTRQDCLYPMDTSVQYPIDKNGVENTTSKSNTTSINKGKTKFSPPTLKEVEDYCLERQNSIDPQAFIDHYESQGWYVGKNKMKNWQAAIRTWERNDKKFNSNNSSQKKRINPTYDNKEEFDNEIDPELLAILKDEL